MAQPAYHLVYVTLSRMIVLYSRCRVNWGTNMFVVLNYVINIIFDSTTFGLSVGRSQPMGCIPHHVVCSITPSFGARVAHMSDYKLLM